MAVASPSVDDCNDSESQSQHHRVGSHTARHRFSVASCSEKVPQSNEKASEESDNDDDAKAFVVATAATTKELEVQKLWNLRLRRAPVTTTMTSNSEANNNTSGEVHEEEAGPKQPTPKLVAEGPSMEKKKRIERERE
ncbi:hypothetical protein ACLB2K_035049 [Fragaria x ananassa]